VVLAYCVMLGWRFHRWRGALLALTVASLPASLIVFAWPHAGAVDQYAAVRVMLAVGILAAGGVVVGSAWHLIRPYLTETSAFGMIDDRLDSRRAGHRRRDPGTRAARGGRRQQRVPSACPERADASRGARTAMNAR
jgi:hypothetical protein